jgi:hypothetical protein
MEVLLLLNWDVAILALADGLLQGVGIGVPVIV